MAVPDHTLVSSPRISPAGFHAVLTVGNSPAAAENLDHALYRICVEYGIDPAAALAFFRKESSLGTAGVGKLHKSWGNRRESEDNVYPRKRHVRPNGEDIGFFAVFPSYAASLRDWCRYMLRRYVQRGLTTVEQILPVYAPKSDGNDPRYYATQVNALIVVWSTRYPTVAAPDPWTAWGEIVPLNRDWAIPRRWLKEGNLGAPLGHEQTLGPSRAAQAFERGVIVWLGGERTEVVR